MSTTSPSRKRSPTTLRTASRTAPSNISISRVFAEPQLVTTTAATTLQPPPTTAPKLRPSPSREFTLPATTTAPTATVTTTVTTESAPKVEFYSNGTHASAATSLESHRRVATRKASWLSLGGTPRSREKSSASPARDEADKAVADALPAEVALSSSPAQMNAYIDQAKPREPPSDVARPSTSSHEPQSSDSGLHALAAAPTPTPTPISTPTTPVAHTRARTNWFNSLRKVSSSSRNIANKTTPSTPAARPHIPRFFPPPTPPNETSARRNDVAPKLPEVKLTPELVTPLPVAKNTVPVEATSLIPHLDGQPQPPTKTTTAPAPAPATSPVPASAPMPILLAEPTPTLSLSSASAATNITHTAAPASSSTLTETPPVPAPTTPIRRGWFSSKTSLVSPSPANSSKSSLVAPSPANASQTSSANPSRTNLAQTLNNSSKTSLVSDSGSSLPSLPEDGAVSDSEMAPSVVNLQDPNTTGYLFVPPELASESMTSSTLTVRPSKLPLPDLPVPNPPPPTPSSSSTLPSASTQAPSSSSTLPSGNAQSSLPVSTGTMRYTFGLPILGGRGKRKTMADVVEAAGQLHGLGQGGSGGTSGEGNRPGGVQTPKEGEVESKFASRESLLLDLASPLPTSSFAAFAAASGSPITPATIYHPQPGTAASISTFTDASSADGEVTPTPSQTQTPSASANPTPNPSSAEVAAPYSWWSYIGLGGNDAVATPDASPAPTSEAKADETTTPTHASSSRDDVSSHLGGDNASSDVPALIGKKKVDEDAPPAVTPAPAHGSTSARDDLASASSIIDARRIQKPGDGGDGAAPTRSLPNTPVPIPSVTNDASAQTQSTGDDAPVPVPEIAQSVKSGSKAQPEGTPPRPPPATTSWVWGWVYPSAASATENPTKTSEVTTGSTTPDASGQTTANGGSVSPKTEAEMIKEEALARPDAVETERQPESAPLPEEVNPVPVPKTEPEPEPEPAPVPSNPLITPSQSALTTTTTTTTSSIWTSFWSSKTSRQMANKAIESGSGNMEVMDIDEDELEAAGLASKPVVANGPVVDGVPLKAGASTGVVSKKEGNAALVKREANALVKKDANDTAVTETPKPQPDIVLVPARASSRETKALATAKGRSASAAPATGGSPIFGGILGGWNGSMTNVSTITPPRSRVNSTSVTSEPERGRTGQDGSGGKSGKQDKGPAPPLTNSDTIKKKTSGSSGGALAHTSNTSSRNASPASGSKRQAAAGGSGGATPGEKGKTPNFVLPTFGDSFFTLPRAIPPPPSPTSLSAKPPPPPPQRKMSASLTKKALGVVSGLMFGGGGSAGRSAAAKKSGEGPKDEDDEHLTPEEMIQYLEERRDRAQQRWDARHGALRANGGGSMPPSESPYVVHSSASSIASGIGPSAPSISSVNTAPAALGSPSNNSANSIGGVTLGIGRIAHIHGGGHGHQFSRLMDLTHPSATYSTQQVRHLMKNPTASVRQIGKDLPRLWSVLGESKFGHRLGEQAFGGKLGEQKVGPKLGEASVSVSVSSPTSITASVSGLGAPSSVVGGAVAASEGRVNGLKIVVIGIHGWFPGAVIRTMLGEPTGTSSRFASMMGAAVEDYVEKNNLPLQKLTLINLEGEGTIARRVAKLYQDLLDHPQWVQDVHEADVVFVATHSQGSIVSTQLIASLIEDGHLRTEHNRDAVLRTFANTDQAPPSHPQNVLCLALCGIHLGPLLYLNTGSLTQPYFTYFESAAARELFEFQDTSSEVSMRYVASLGVALGHGVKFVYIASLDDQVVPIYSGSFVTATHPLILRALYIDGDAYNTSDFLSNLIVFLLRVRNAGLDDGGLITHLSEATAGSLSGVGHSSPYLNDGCYDLAVRFLFETSGVVGVEKPALRIDPFQARATRNDYEIPWALRGVISDPAILSLFASEIAELRQAFDEWAPKTTILKDLRRKLEPIQSLRILPPSPLALHGSQAAESDDRSELTSHSIAALSSKL